MKFGKIYIYRTCICMYVYFTKGKNEHCFLFIKNGAGWGVILGSGE
jgi:hypothetical protein